MNRFFIVLWVSMVISAPLLAAEIQDGSSAILGQMIPILQGLSENIEAINDIQKQMDDSKASDENYNEKKNIWLSSVLTFTAIVSVCEYEHDLLELFLDLSPKNRARYVEVRIQSIESSIRQIEIFKAQIEINRLLLGENQSNKQFFVMEDRIIARLLSLLQQSVSIVRSIR
jgi:hypothetical protein